MIPFLIGAVIGSVNTATASEISSEDEIFYTTKEIARMLKITEYTVRKKIREGIIKAEVIPGKYGYRIRKSDLENYLTEKNTSGTNRNLKSGFDKEHRFENLLGKISSIALNKSSNDIDTDNLKLLKEIIAGKETDLKGLKLRLQMLELDNEETVEFKKKRLSLEIAINDLEAEIKAFQISEMTLSKTQKNTSTETVGTEKNNLHDLEN